MVWLPNGEKNMFIHFNTIDKRDGQTDRHCMTAKPGRTCIALHGKNRVKQWLYL